MYERKTLMDLETGSKCLASCQLAAHVRMRHSQTKVAREAQPQGPGSEQVARR